MDIQCFRLLPHILDNRVILDIQQIIPLPEAETYQVKLREKSQAVRIARSQKGQWNLEKLLKAITENDTEESAKSAKDIYDWSSQLMGRIWWSEAKIDGSFIPTWDGPKDTHWFFAVRSTGKIELYLGAMAKKAPFNNFGLREEFIRRINTLGANIPIEKSIGYPKFPLSILSTPSKMKLFQEIIQWAFEEAHHINATESIEE